MINPPNNSVGPVLRAGPLAALIVQAIKAANQEVTIIDRGSYLRVHVPGRCVLRRDLVEQYLGAPFLLPGDLESVMSSFMGRLTISENSAVWEAT